MSKIITAVYENGILRPLDPVTLAERQRVRLQIIPTQEAENVDHIFQALHEAGVITPPRGSSEYEPVPDEEQYRLAKVLGEATLRPLSEIVIEDRGK